MCHVSNNNVTLTVYTRTHGFFFSPIIFRTWPAQHRRVGDTGDSSPRHKRAAGFQPTDPQQKHVVFIIVNIYIRYKNRFMTIYIHKYIFIKYCNNNAEFFSNICFFLFRACCRNESRARAAAAAFLYTVSGAQRVCNAPRSQETGGERRKDQRRCLHNFFSFHRRNSVLKTSCSQNRSKGVRKF